MRTFGHDYDVVCFYHKSNHKGLIPLIWSRPFFSPYLSPSKNFYRTAIFVIMERPNIMIYEPPVWNCSDLLIGAGIKQSDFPAFMMQYLALKSWRAVCFATETGKR